MQTDADKGQFFFQIGGYPFHLTPVTILKCDLIAGECLYGTKEEIDEYKRLTENLQPYLMSLSNDTDPALFCRSVQNRVGAIVETEKLTTPLARSHVRNLQARLSNCLTLRKATADARTYGTMLTEWLHGASGEMIDRAIECIQSYGVTPLLPPLGTVGNLGPLICGQYQPALHTVVAQLDVLARKSNPPLHFLDVLLHEQVHASIYQNLGCDPTRRELEWLHELAAITTSHQAITDAGRSLGLNGDVAAACRTLRSEQKYGDLAQSVLDSMADPLIAWKIWQDIFLLPEAARSQYARREILSPILWERGWTGNLPFSLPL